MIRRSSATSLLRGAAALVIAAVGFSVATPQAIAQVAPALAVTPQFASPVAVGQTGDAASLQIVNDADVSVNVATITLVPSCGQINATGACPAGSVDLGVFRLSTPGTGESGTTCAGDSFTISAPDSTGQVSFTTTPDVALPASGTCTIDFTFDVLKHPANPVKGTSSETAQLGFASGKGVGVAASGGGSSTTTVLAQPTLTTTPTATAGIGQPVSDTATLSAGFNPTGTINFELFAATGSPCDTDTVFSSSVTVSGNGDYNSGTTTLAATGNYHWQVSYEGDANNESAGESCPNEVTTVAAQSTPTLTTTASGEVTVGGTVSDTATLSAGNAPTGTIEFALYPTDDCGPDGEAVFTSNVTVSGNGTYASDTFTTTQAGSFEWLASYSGDSNNVAVSDSCGDEPVTVDQVTPTLTTTASVPNPSDTTIFDTATLSGGFNDPQGNIVFDLFGPDDPSCSSDPVFTDTESVDGNGDYQSESFTPAGAGTYNWTAQYTGDVNDTSVTTTCGAEPVSEIGIPSITTQASGAVAIGGAISDTATIAGGDDPTGTIAFTAFGPDDDSCANTPAFTSVVAVSGDGSYASGSFTPTSTGSYSFTASYSGDANNAGDTTACNDSGESVTVSEALPVLETTASDSVPVGGTITDSANFIGSDNPTGTITFDLFAPDDPACDDPVATSTVMVNGDGSATYTSDPFTADQVGTYQFEASYSGDANNAPVGFSTCGASGESVDVTQATPTISTIATQTEGLGGSISDTATISGGDDPTGTLEFNVYGPNFETCDTDPTATFEVTVDGNGDYTSPPFTPTSPGDYQWSTHYNGDADNSFANTFCGDPNETSTVVPTLTITTATSGEITLGGNITDSADLEGGDGPTGTITFTAYGPDDPTCAAAPVFTSTVDVTDGDGTYTSDSFTPTEAGTFLFIAAYSGDDGNGAVTTNCNDPNESAVVDQVNPSLSTTASPSVTAGGQISDTAELEGGDNPTGTITFAAYGPNDDSECSDTPAFTSTTTVDGNGTYSSDQFTAVEVGQYDFVATYSGDTDNSTVTTSCADENESVQVTNATPTLTTTATATVALGGTISDTADLEGGAEPTGEVEFFLVGPNRDGCDTTSAFSASITANGNGTYSSGSFTPTEAGTYFWQAFYSGDGNNNDVVTDCPDPAETSVVTATTTLTTTASPPVTIGGTISDTADLEGGAGPTGTITFNAYGPNDPTCDAAPAFTSTVGFSTGDGTHTSDPFTPTEPGTYLFVASYSGDSANSPATTVCGDANESVVVSAAVPTLTTQASSGVATGGTITDTATLAGGVGPTGTITFNVFGPNDASCDNAAAFTSTTDVSGNGNYSSASFTATAPGTYRFVAEYSGDGSNQAVTTLCNDPGESVVVSQATPALTTTASASVPVGGTLDDTATLSGGVGPSGTITFDLFGPNNATCTGTAIFTSTVTVAGNGNYTSASFTATTPGTYNFEASYSGDANNAAATAACGAAGESVTVTQAAPSIATTASAGVAVGGTVSDTATIAGGVAPTGSITFRLFGPGDNTCDNTPAFTTTTTVTGNGTYASAPFTTTKAGTYSFVADYSGDADNAAALSACGAANETVVVGAAAPTITTAASATTNAGGTIFDTATLSGGFNPTGTITFNLFQDSCDSSPIFTTTATVAGDGTYTSSSFTTTAPGSYLWSAGYGGDANNQPVTSACGDVGETTKVLALPTVTTTASAPVALGGTISDTATLAGGNKPTGTITFQAFGPGDTVCETALFTSTITVGGDGNYTSQPFTPTKPGTYQFVASYSGDDNNAAATTACGAPNESVDVLATTPTVVTQASAGVSVGGDVSDVATLAGGTAPTGTISFALFGPNDPECSTDPVFTSMTAVSGNGSYDSGTFAPAVPGTYRFVATYSGDADNNAVVTGCGDESESVVVQPASPAVTTVASGSVVVGGAISDTATLAGGVDPTGTITFDVFGPDDSECSGPIAFTSTVTVTGDGTYASGPFTPGSAGTYIFTATYNGDADNNATVPLCGDANESVVVTNPPLSLTTAASPSVPAGGTIDDTATLSGGTDPTGTITFLGYGPDDPSCAGPAAFTSTTDVDGDGSYSSASFTAADVGTYLFMASYGGDANNAATTTTCGDPSESVTVTATTPTLATTPSESVAVGGSVSDTALLFGGSNPSGTITFLLFGPNDPTCSTVPVFTSTAAVDGNGTYTSDAFTATAPGSYLWVADYSGDGANNDGTTTSCGDEAVVVSLVIPSLTTAASGPASVGGSINDTAFLTGLANPTGTITFDLFGPDDPTCSASPVSTSVVTVDGDGTYQSDSFTTTDAGTYQFEASYSGDANNGPLTTACGDSGESVSVTATPTITTQASPTVPVGGAIADTATLSGGVGATGTITFSLFGPDDFECSNGSIFTSTVSVDGNGSYPSDPFTTVAPGTYEYIASYSGDANNNAIATNCGDPGESVVVTSSTVFISTEASGSVAVGDGDSIFDTATLSGGNNPTGTITFNAYGPDDPTCSSDAVFTTTVDTEGDGSYTSDSFTPDVAGTYNWVASYNDDSGTVSTNCGDPNESVVVTPTPTITTDASSSVAVGGTISDTATLTEGLDPTGTITFSLFGPDDFGCSNGSIFTSTVSVDGNGDYTSDPFTTLAPGSYLFIASYSGDDNNPAVATNCGDEGESVEVTSTTVFITTQASGSVVLGDGGSIDDTATIDGGDEPSGTITFNAYGPADPTCSSDAVFTTTVDTEGDGSYTSDSFTPDVAGTYNWVASYSDDSGTVSTNCGDPNESSTVFPPSPTITTTASASIGLGGSIADTATLTGVLDPEGSITFSVFGPDDFECSNGSVFTSTVTVDGNGNYESQPFTPTASGVYQFIASYSGDANNAQASTNCGDEGESVDVGSATPTLATTPSGPIPAGGALTDTADLTGGFEPQGSITFILFGAGDTACSSVPLFTSTESVDGNGVYTSGPFTALQVGTYRWVADYSGDATNNSGVTSSCGDEIATVTPAVTAITTNASPSVLLGGAIYDTADLTGGANPTGTVVFDAFGPDDSECAGEPAFTSSQPVTANGTITSGPFTPTAVGTYQFVASYSGDANNAAAATSCGDASEAVVVTTTTTTTTTSTTSTTSTTVPVTTTTSTSTTSTSTTSTSTTSTSTTSTTSTSTTSTTIPATTTTSTSTTSTTTPPTTSTTATTTPPTTTVPTTTPPTTAGPTTVPVTTTTRPPTTTTAPRRTTTATTAATVPVTTTSSTSTTTSTTSTTVPTTTTTPTTLGPPSAVLHLDRISTPPGGPAVAMGQGCVPGSPVILSIGPMIIGHAVASAAGTFTSTLQLNVPVGHYTITAECGVTLTAGIDVVLSSQANPPSTTEALLLILLLLILVLATNQLSSR